MNRCAGCGLTIEGGTEACQSLMHEATARDFSDVTYFRVHRLMVDIYCLQHPDRYCVSFKSLAAHLMHVCWSLEHGGGRAVPSEALRLWVENHPHLPKPVLPEGRGALTILDVLGAEGPVAHADTVDRWARSTWAAYASVHDEARRWVRMALDGAPRHAPRRMTRSR